MNNVVILIFFGFILGVFTGVAIARATTEKKEIDLLKKIEELGNRNNDILDEVRQVISFNNKLANRNQELEDQLTKFVKEWT